jgi:glycosyltransferase involved in cell wall biosynthesis
VLSSRIEGESLAILEAMSAQRPIVATAVGGTPGLLANGECGLLVPPGDAQAMAQAIVELLTNRAKAQELARRARERFLQEYTIDRMGERYVEAIREGDCAASGKRPNPRIPLPYKGRGSNSPLLCRRRVGG